MSGLLLIEALRRHARERPEAVAYREAETGKIWTWKKLHDCSGRLAGKLRRELSPRAVVVLTGKNEPQFVAGFLGILRAGMAAFPLAAGPEFDGLAKQAGAAMILGPEISFEGEAGEDGDWRTAALLLTSSGTTGRPKIVRRNAASLNAVIEAVCGPIGFGAEDRVVGITPLHHSYGLEHGLLAPVFGGSAVTLFRAFDLSMAVGELRDGATIFPAVPFMIEALARGEFAGRFESLRRVYSAGGKLPSGVAERFVERFGVGVGQVYGTTEVGSVTFSDPMAATFNPRSVGRAMRGVEIRLNDGQLAIRAGAMFEGYLNEKEPAIVDGYFPTGDLAEMDSDGNLILTGRSKLLIDVGGKKVNPMEVEEVFGQHPGVAACVVVAMPLGETVTRLEALVVPRAVGPALKVEDLREFARRRLSAFKLPRVIELRDSLPVSATGKILRELVKE